MGKKKTTHVKCTEAAKRHNTDDNFDKTECEKRRAYSHG